MRKNENTAKKSKSVILYALLLFGITFLFFFQTKKFGLSNFDDDNIIPRIVTAIDSDNPYLTALTTDAMVRNTVPFYRPLQNISYIIDLKLSDTNETWMLHLTNVFLYSLIAVALFFFLLELKFPQKLSLIGSLIFCFHPLFVSSVAWIPARGDLFLTLFSLLSFTFFLKFLKTTSWDTLILCSLFFILALFGKETAAFLPILFLFYFLFQRPIKLDKKHIFLVIILFILGLIWFFTRNAFIGKTLDETTYSNHFSDIISNIKFIPTGLSLIIFPSDLTTIPAYTLFKIVSGTILIGASIFLIFRKNGTPKIHKLFYFSWYIILLIPASLIKQRYFDYLDHRFLLPSIGILLFGLSCLPERIIKNDIQKTTIPLVLIVIFAGITFIKLQAYRSPMDFCNASITKNYKQPVALNNRGSIEYNQMNFQDALKDYNEALAINKEYVLCYINRGGTRFMLKDYAGAVNDFSEAIKRNKNPYTEFYFRGLSYASINRFDLAIKDLNHYILLNPNEVLGYYHKGRMLSYIGKQDEAIEVFNQVIKINPYFSEAFSERALAKLRKGDPSGAITDCYSALQIKPNNESANKIISDAQNMINSKSSKK